MQLNDRVLLDFLEEIDRELEKRITLVAVGGTALTLLGAKRSTIDVDFTVTADDYDEYVCVPEDALALKPANLSFEGG